MGIKLTKEEKGVLADHLAEVYRVTSNGTRNFPDVCKALQNIVEGKLVPVPLIVTTPSWQTLVDMQIEKVSAFLELHGGGQEGFRASDIPAVPDFTPRTKTERLLLAVYLPNKVHAKGLRRTFDAWWDFIVPPIGLTMHRCDELRINSKRLRLASGIEYKPGIRWVAFDPNTYQGKSPKDALAQSAIDGTTLAHAEVLMAAAMFPEWVSSWNGGKSPYPNMSALQFHWNTHWSLVPFFHRWDDGSRLDLLTLWNDRADALWSSPTVWEC